MTVNKLQLPAKQNAVQLKINEIIDNLGGGGAFIAEYDVTSYTDILTAHNAGREITCKWSGVQGTTQAWQSNTYRYIPNSTFSFEFAIEGYVYRAIVDTNNTWSYNIISYENASNKVTSISSSSTDTQYPSAKCVYDELSNKADTSELPTKVSDLTNDEGYITGINSSDVTTALGYTPYNSTNPNNFITSSALAPYELINKPVTTLANSGTLALSDNTAYRIVNASGAITFTLPTVTNLTVLHRIEIELNMSTVQSVDLGLGSTPNWFNETELDLSEAGTYNILYQYSPSKSAWYCGGAKIGSAA